MEENHCFFVFGGICNDVELQSIMLSLLPLHLHPDLNIKSGNGNIEK